MKNTFLTSILLFTVTILTINSCSDYDDNLKAIQLEDLIQKDSELFTVIQKSVKNISEESEVCVEFVYPIVVFEYDSNLTIIQNHNIFNDDDMIDLLNNLSVNNSISISYPINTTLNNGNVFSINNNDELLANLKECYQETTIEECNDICFPISADKCFWKVQFNEDNNNTFYLSSFESRNNGAFYFYHDNEILEATWIFLFIEDNLHLNINIEGQNSATAAWNFNWLVEYIDESIIHLINLQGDQFKLHKTCTSTIPYVVGEEGPSGGITLYDKGEYSNGWRYIEAAPDYLTTINLQWGCDTNNIANTDYTELGEGLINTKNIVNYHLFNNFYLNPSICSSLNNGSVAAFEVGMYELNNYTDWILPSNEECILIHNIINNIGTSLILTNFWSSTENSVTNAYFFNMNTQDVDTIIKSDVSIKTLPIRYF
jgi:hypothetical protein